MSSKNPEDYVKGWSLAKVMKNLPIALEKAKYMGQYIQDFKDLTSLLKDYSAGNYRNISPVTIGMVTAVVAYVIFPLDMVPDFLPVLGFGDDIAFLTVTLNKIHEELVAYKEWKSSQ